MESVDHKQNIKGLVQILKDKFDRVIEQSSVALKALDELNSNDYIRTFASRDSPLTSSIDHVGMLLGNMLYTTRGVSAFLDELISEFRACGGVPGILSELFRLESLIREIESNIKALSSKIDTVKTSTLGEVKSLETVKDLLNLVKYDITAYGNTINVMVNGTIPQDDYYDDVPIMSQENAEPVFFNYNPEDDDLWSPSDEDEYIDGDHDY